LIYIFYSIYRLIAARESNGKGVEITLVSSCTDGSKEFDARQGICV